jgi:translin
MLNKREFEKIREEFALFEEKRELMIKSSRETINLSKRIIYALHRGDITSASSLIKEIEKKKKLVESFQGGLDTNINQTALQEYVEALCYYQFVKNKKIPTSESLKVESVSYLLGLCDLTGELVRKAVNEVIKKNFSQALAIKELVEEIYAEFLKFNLRNSELRNKSDQIKWNLKKLEDIVFELKIKGKL